jgi:hypothetical protein
MGERERERERESGEMRDERGSQSEEERERFLVGGGWGLGGEMRGERFDVEQLLGALVVDLERRVADAEALARHAWSSRRRAWQSSPGGTSTCAASAGKPEVTSQTCRSWTSTTPGWRPSARPIACGSIPSGAPSSSTRPESREQLQPDAQHQRRDQQRRDRSAAVEAETEDDRAGRAAPATRRGPSARARARPRR